MKTLSSKWQKLIVWLTGYLNIVAFFLAGGYIFTKTEDEDVKKSAKTVFLITLLFTVIDIVRLIIYNCASVDENYDGLTEISKFNLIMGVIKAVVFVTFSILDFFGIKVIPVDFLDGKKKEENEQEEQ